MSVKERATRQQDLDGYIQHILGNDTPTETKSTTTKHKLKLNPKDSKIEPGLPDVSITSAVPKNTENRAFIANLEGETVKETLIPREML